MAKRKRGVTATMIQRIRNWLSSYGSFIIGVPPFVWQVLFVYVPLTLVVMLSIVRTTQYGDWAGITLSHFYHVIDPIFMQVIGRSLLLAISTAFISLVIGYPVAYYIAFTSRAYKYMWLYLLIIPFWTNFLFHAFAWTFIFERNGVLNTLLMYLHIIDEPIHILNTQIAVYVMMVYSYFPFMVMPIYTALEKINYQFLEVSYDLGATWWQTFRNVIMPLSMSGVQGGFFLVFIPAFGEFAIPELLGGDRTMYVGSVISHYILDAWTQSLGAAFTLVSAFVLLIASICIIICMRWLEGVRS